MNSTVRLEHKHTLPVWGRVFPNQNEAIWISYRWMIHEGTGEKNNSAAHLLWFRHWHANECSHAGVMESFHTGTCWGVEWLKWPWVGASHIFHWQEGEQKKPTHRSFPLVCPHLPVGDGKMIVRGTTNGARAEQAAQRLITGSSGLYPHPEQDHCQEEGDYFAGY